MEKPEKNFPKGMIALVVMVIICAILDDTSSVIDDELKKWAQIADACDDILYDRYTKLHKDIKEV